MSAPRAVQRPLGELLTGRQKFVLLNSLMLAIFISALDGSIVATATPHILADLGGFDLLSWVFTIYLLTSTVVVALAGKLSDMYGRKPFILAGIVIFVAASAVCGAAPSMILLIVARAVQGIGGGILFGVVFATLGDLFTPIERARYMGYFIGAFTLASLVGPTLGGFLTDGPGWRWCFYVNLPVGVLASAAILRTLPYTKKGGSIKRIDFLGAIFLSSATICVLLALVWANTEFGWGSVETVGLFAAGALLLAAFAFQEGRHPEAIFPLSLFRNRVFVQANLLDSLRTAGMYGPIPYLPTFIQIALGASATDSGLVSTPQALGLLVASIFGGQLIARSGQFKYQIIAGSVLSLLSAFLLRALDLGEPEWHIALYMVLMGLGTGMIGPTISVVVQSSVTHEFMGVATSGRQFFNQIGQVLGVAVFGLIFTTTYASALSTAIPSAQRAQIPPAVYAKFADPTLALDAQSIATVRATVLALPRGQEILDQALHSQKLAVSSAIDRLFWGATIVAGVVLFLSLFLKEIPLRSSFEVGAAERESRLAAELIG